MGELSEHDAAVLNAILYPNLPLCESREGVELKDVEDETLEMQMVRKMEIEAVQLAEIGRTNEAVEILNKALNITPDRASVYNNRAHVFQFQRKFTEALQDLTQAIELAQQNGQNKTLTQALCQRGILYRRDSKFEEARSDFEAAAKMGSPFARSQLVELNPYAALCNQMLRKVMDNLG